MKIKITFDPNGEYGYGNNRVLDAEQVVQGYIEHLNEKKDADTIKFLKQQPIEVAIGFVADMWNLEYEYLYLDREISIDKILSKQKRKKVRTLELSKMEFICPKNSHQLDPYKARNVKTADFSSKDPEARVWALLYKDQNSEEIILLEANDEMIKAIKSVYPRKVIEI